MNSGDTARPTDGVDGAWSRVDRLALIALAIALGVTLIWTVHPWFDKANDASLYLLTARSIASGEGFTYLGDPFVVRPPGWAALLSPFVGSEAPPNFQLVNLIGALFGIGASIALFWLARPRLGGPLAAVLALVIWLNPSVQRLSTQALSDVPGLALILITLVTDRAARERRSLPLHLALASVLAVAIYVRTLAVLLIPAILLGRVLSAREPGTPRVVGGKLALALIVPILAFAPWVVRNANADVTTPTEQVFLRSYGTAMVHTDAGDPSSERITFAEFGERGKPAERVAAQLARKVQRFTSSAVPVGEHLADQLLLPLAIGAWQGSGGGQFRTLDLTNHTRTHIDIIKAFLDVDVRVNQTSADDVLIEIEQHRGAADPPPCRSSDPAVSNSDPAVH